LFGYFMLILLGKLDDRQSFPGLIFLGGFFLSLLWETKSRYVYPYMVMVLPCIAESLVFYADSLYVLLSGKLRAIKMSDKNERGK